MPPEPDYPEPEVREFLSFRRVPAYENPKGVTLLWFVNTVDESDNLGHIDYRPGWRRYVFHPNGDTTFDAACLREIAQFLDDHKTDRKAKVMG